jgi:homoserine dehydrogenase
MGDVIDTAEKILNRSTGTGMIMTDISRIPFYSSQKLRSPYYFRLIVDDATGVLADISHIFAEHDISIKTVTQKSQHDDVAELVLVVESSPRENIMKVEKALAGLSCVRKTANIIRVLEEN